jgi:hypothetical protein
LQDVSCAPEVLLESDLRGPRKVLGKATDVGDVRASARFRAEESAWPAASMPTYQPTYSVPVTLPAPSVYVAPTPNWSSTVDYVPHVQPAPQYVPVVPGPATGAGGGGLLTQ